MTEFSIQIRGDVELRQRFARLPDNVRTALQSKTQALAICICRVRLWRLKRSSTIPSSSWRLQNWPAG